MKWWNDDGLDWSDSTGIDDLKFNSEYILNRQNAKVCVHREIRNDVKDFGLNSRFLYLSENVAASVSGNQKKIDEGSKIWVAL